MVVHLPARPPGIVVSGRKEMQGLAKRNLITKSMTTLSGVLSVQLLLQRWLGP